MNAYVSSIPYDREQNCVSLAFAYVGMRTSGEDGGGIASYASVTPGTPEMNSSSILTSLPRPLPAIKSRISNRNTCKAPIATPWYRIAQPSTRTFEYFKTLGRQI